MSESLDNSVQLVFKLGYCGTEYSGFQAQAGQRTISGELSFALETLFKRELEITCAGRTDAGVHAKAQHVNIALSKTEAESLQPETFLRSINALLPDDIEVYSVFRAKHSDFSCRFDALTRKYIYRIARIHPSLVAPHYSWYVAQELNKSAMQKAAKAFLGEHDFTTYCKKASSEDKNCVRIIHTLAINEAKHFEEAYMEISIEGSGFLHNMVRIIVGTLVEVGTGQRPVESIAQTILAKDRRVAGRTAPSQGLVFEEVRYPKGALVWLAGEKVCNGS